MQLHRNKNSRSELKAATDYKYNLLATHFTRIYVQYLQSSQSMRQPAQLTSAARLLVWLHNIQVHDD